MTTISKKQLEANKKNAKKGGVKTEEGKEVVKYNALKHGLLAKEVVITVGEGAEDPEEFNRLLEDLRVELIPEGTLEEMLVEKIAVAYWRLRRAYKYEVGLVRDKIDTASDDYYRTKNWEGKRPNKLPEEIENEIERQQTQIDYWEKDHTELIKMHKSGKTTLKDIYDWDVNWEFFQETAAVVLSDERLKHEQVPPQEVHERMVTEGGWTDEQIWKRLIEICVERVSFYKQRIVELERKRERNALKLQVIKRLGNIPTKDELDRLLRYESTIERQLYKALNQLERMQRFRQGDNVPPPLEVDVNVNSDQPA